MDVGWKAPSHRPAQEQPVGAAGARATAAPVAEEHHALEVVPLVGAAEVGLGIALVKRLGGRKGDARPPWNQGHPMDHPNGSPPQPPKALRVQKRAGVLIGRL